MAWVSSWLLGLGVANAGEPVLSWDPAVLELGRWGHVTADFDGDGLLDHAATTGRPGQVSAIVVQLGGRSDPTTYTLPVAEGTASLGTGDLDGDGHPELLVALPTADHDLLRGAGLVLIVSPDAAPGASVALLDHADLGVVGSADREFLGASALLQDLDGDGFDELLIGAPGANNNGVVWVFDHASSGLVDFKNRVGSWSMLGEGLGFGAGIAVIQVAGVPTVVVATCGGYDPTLESCVGGDLVPTAASGSATDPVLPDTLDPSRLSAVPRAFFRAAVGADDVVAHVTTNGVQTFSLTGGPALRQTLTADATDAGAALVGDLTGDGAPDWLLQDGDVVRVVSELTASGTASDLAVDSFSLASGALGARLSGTDDLDGDGCADALATAPDARAVYLLPGTCGPPDTGDTGEPADTGDTGTEPTDTGDTGTEPADTGDTGTEPTDSGGVIDTGECQEEFGWACASGGARGGGWAVVLGLLGALGRRRWCPGTPGPGRDTTPRPTSSWRVVAAPGTLRVPAPPWNRSCCCRPVAPDPPRERAPDPRRRGRVGQSPVEPPAGRSESS